MAPGDSAGRAARSAGPGPGLSGIFDPLESQHAALEFPGIEPLAGDDPATL